MITEIVSSSELFNYPIWSLQYLVSQKQTKLQSLYPIIALKDLVKERKEIVTPRNYPEKLFNYIGLENIESNVRVLANVNPKMGQQIKSSAKVYKRGDILYGRLRPSLNKVYLVTQDSFEGICSTEIFVLTPNEEIINSEYLAEVLISEIVKKKAIALVRGASLPRIQIDDFLRIKIPVPPRKEQETFANFILEQRDKWLEYRIRVQEIPNYIKEELVNKVMGNRLLD